MKKRIIAVYLLACLCICGCSQTVEQKDEKTLAPEPTEYAGSSEAAGAKRYTVVGAYMQMDESVQVEYGIRYNRYDGGIVPIYKIANGEAYAVEENVVHIKKPMCLYDIDAPQADTIIIDKNVELADDNIDYEVDGKAVIAEYDSWFHGCPKVKEIHVKKREYIHDEKLWTDAENESTNREHFIGGNLFVKNNMLMFAYPCKGVVACPMPEKQATIPEGTKTIYSNAFQKCHKMKNIVIASSVESIGEGAFGYNDKLQKIEVEKGNKQYKSVDGVLYSQNGKTLLSFPAGKKDTEFHVPRGVKKIAAAAFIGNKTLKKVFLSDTVSYIGEKAFMDCRNLEGVSCKKEIKRIVKTAFINCDKLKEWPKRKKLI